MDYFRAMSPVKKTLLGLGLAGAAVGGFSLPTDGGQSQFERFLTSADKIMVSAYNKVVNKQTPINSLAEIVTFADSVKIKPGTFGENPQPYAKVAVLHAPGDLSKITDFSQSSPYNNLLEQLDSDLAMLKADNPRIQGSAAQGLSDEGVRSLKDYIGSLPKDTKVLGYTLEQRKHEVRVHLIEGLDNRFGESAKSVLSEQNPGNKNMQDWQEPGVSFTRSQYSSDVLETFSDLGVGPTRAYKSIAKAAEFVSVYDDNEKRDLTSRSDTALLALSLPLSIALDIRYQGEKVPEDFLKAAKAFQIKNQQRFTDPSAFSEQGFIKSIATLTPLDANKVTGRTLSQQKTALSALWAMKGTQTDPWVQDLKLTIDKPCSNEAARIVKSDQLDPVFEYTKACASQYGYGVPTYWANHYSESVAKQNLTVAPTLIGFEKGVAVFVSEKDGNHGGMAYTGYWLKDKLEANKAKDIHRDLYEPAYVMIAPNGSRFETLNAQEKLLAMKFVLHHEVGHILEKVSVDGNSEDANLQGRSMAHETQVDVYAAQQLVREGYSKEKVIKMHENYIFLLDDDPQMRMSEVSGEFIDHAKSLVWDDHSMLAMTKKELQAGKTKPSLWENPLASMSYHIQKGDIFKENQKIESNLRHFEVKEALKDFDPKSQPWLIQQYAPVDRDSQEVFKHR